MSASSNAINRQSPRTRFQDLPTETQRQIVSYVGRKDLFSLQILNRHFRGIASAEIYRALDFNIISSETEDVGNPASRAADALQTILTSDYDYGQHIKSFRMGAVADKHLAVPHSRHHGAYDDTLLMTRLLWGSKTDPSKFLNTALLLMARKACILETFKWDAPIELSSAVYQALHKVTSLRHLLVRLDVQPSPKIIQRQPHHPPPPGMPPGPFPPAPLPSTTVQTYTPSFESSISKRRKVGGSKFWSKQRAFSGFKQLNTLEVVGISNLECLSEIAQCITASSASLKALTLTLSSDLARRSRKPAVTTTTATILDDDVTDTDLYGDDFTDPPPPPASSGNQPANEADIREEKLAQDNILATVFDLQSVAQVGKKLEKKLSLAGGKCLEDDDFRAGQDKFVAMMKSLRETPLDVEQAKSIKNFLDSFIKSQLGPTKKPTISPTKTDTVDNLKEANKVVMAKKKHLLIANASSLKPAGLSNELNGLMDNLSSMEGDNHDLDTFLSPPYGPGSSSAKPSAYDFPSTTYYNGGNSYADLPSMNPPPLPNSSKDKQINGEHQLYQALSAESSKDKPMDSEQQIYDSSSGLSYNPSVAVPYSMYPHSHTSSDSLTPTINPSLYQPYGLPGPYSAPAYSPPFGTAYPNKSTISLSKHSKQPKAKKYTLKKAKLPKPMSLPSSDDSELDVKTKRPSAPELSTFSAKSDEQPVESMDVDMDHPDENASDPGEDQEFMLEGDTEQSEEWKSKRSKRALGQSKSGGGALNEANGTVSEGSTLKLLRTETERAPPPPTAAEAMQDYIRVTHGLQLEEIRLHWIPLKASIIGRALDLTVLQRITLLDVGPQDTFWALLVRLTSVDNMITFRHIHTDHVSKAFTKFLATFEGLEELFMHERNAKSSDTDSDLLVDISGLRKLALSNHICTLKRLMIRNERDDTWDVDTKTLQFLALKAKKMTELACSMKMQTYHLLIQMFAAFTNLHALHLITLRSTDRNPMLQLESLNFAVDSLSHCPGVKLRYLALADQVSSLESRPDHFRKHLKIVMEYEKDRKGKGKAVDFPPPMDKEEDDASDGELDDVLAEVAAGEKRLRFSTRFDDVKEVKIFAKDIRTGRL